MTSFVRAYLSNHAIAEGETLKDIYDDWGDDFLEHGVKVNRVAIVSVSENGEQELPADVVQFSGHLEVYWDGVFGGSITLNGGEEECKSQARKYKAFFRAVNEEVKDLNIRKEVGFRLFLQGENGETVSTTDGRTDTSS